MMYIMGGISLVWLSCALGAAADGDKDAVKPCLVATAAFGCAALTAAYFGA